MEYRPPLQDGRSVQCRRQLEGFIAAAHLRNSVRRVDDEKECEWKMQQWQNIEGQSGLSERSIGRSHLNTTSIPTPSPPTQASLLASLGVMFSQDPPILPPTSLPSPEWADCRD